MARGLTAQQKAQVIIDRRAAGEADADIIVDDPKLVAGYQWLKDQDQKLGGARLQPQSSLAASTAKSRNIPDKPPKQRPVGSGALPDDFVPSFGKG